MTDEQKLTEVAMVLDEWLQRRGVFLSVDTLRDFSAAAFAAKREGEQKQEGEARAAGDDCSVIIWEGDGTYRAPCTPDVKEHFEWHCAELDRVVAMLRAERETAKQEITTLRQRAEAAESKLAETRDPPPKRVYDCLREEVTERTAEADTLRRRSEALDVALRAAESLAKAEREGRESEAVAYRKEIAELREEVEVFDAVAKMAAHDRDEALVAKAEADRICEHWRNLACDPQTRENVNRETERERDVALSVVSDQKSAVAAMSEERDAATRELGRIIRERDETRVELADREGHVAKLLDNEARFRREMSEASAGTVRLKAALTDALEGMVEASNRSCRFFCALDAALLALTTAGGQDSSDRQAIVMATDIIRAAVASVKVP